MLYSVIYWLKLTFLGEVVLVLFFPKIDTAFIGPMLLTRWIATALLLRRWPAWKICRSLADRSSNECLRTLELEWGTSSKDCALLKETGLPLRRRFLSSGLISSSKMSGIMSSMRNSSGNGCPFFLRLFRSWMLACLASNVDFYKDGFRLIPLLLSLFWRNESSWPTRGDILLPVNSSLYVSRFSVVFGYVGSSSLSSVSMFCFYFKMEIGIVSLFMTSIC